ncbi:MAG: hypothetical protein HY555_04915, partial [Euryarchaeota archaeon]|nr:hypothetical protein [Euryarchaeota archaeon]
YKALALVVLVILALWHFELGPFEAGSNLPIEEKVLLFVETFNGNGYLVENAHAFRENYTYRLEVIDGDKVIYRNHFLVQDGKLTFAQGTTYQKLVAVDARDVDDLIRHVTRDDRLRLAVDAMRYGL